MTMVLLINVNSSIVSLNVKTITELKTVLTLLPPSVTVHSISQPVKVLGTVKMLPELLKSPLLNSIPTEITMLTSVIISIKNT